MVLQPGTGIAARGDAVVGGRIDHDMARALVRSDGVGHQVLRLWVFSGRLLVVGVDLWSVPADRMNAWANGQAPFYGFTIRASTSDAHGWKRFWSSNYGTASARPYLAVSYDVIPPGVSAVSPSPNGTVD